MEEPTLSTRGVLRHKRGILSLLLFTPTTPFPERAETRAGTPSRLIVGTVLLQLLLSLFLL